MTFEKKKNNHVILRTNQGSTLIRIFYDDTITMRWVNAIAWSAALIMAIPSLMVADEIIRMWETTPPVGLAAFALIAVGHIMIFYAIGMLAGIAWVSLWCRLRSRICFNSKALIVDKKQYKWIDISSFISEAMPISISSWKVELRHGGRRIVICKHLTQDQSYDLVNTLNRIQKRFLNMR